MTRPYYDQKMECCKGCHYFALHEWFTGELHEACERYGMAFHPQKGVIDYPCEGRRTEEEYLKEKENDKLKKYRRR